MQLFTCHAELERSPLPRDPKARYKPQVTSVQRPDKKATDLSKKTKAEPRPCNESYTTNVTSTTVPPLRLAPVGCEEVALIAKNVPITQPDTGYGTGTNLSSKKKVGKGMFTLAAVSVCTVLNKNRNPENCVEHTYVYCACTHASSNILIR